MARVTLQTIADRVGVSRMTVSNAFSRPDQLSGELRQRILTAAQELGYVGPDPAARALARGAAGAVGVLLTDSLAEAFTQEVATSFLGAIVDELSPTGLALTLLTSTDRDDVVPARDVALDGAIVYSCRPESTGRDWLIRRKLPLVFVDQEPEPDVPSVNIDDRGGARAAAQHLVDLGHRRVGLVNQAIDAPEGPVPDLTSPQAGHAQQQRLLGWLDALSPAGVQPTAVQVRRNSDEPNDVLRALLTGDQRPTAVLCFSDILAVAMVRTVRELGLAVPDDLSVVGFDDSPVARRCDPPLTTVRQDVVAKGRLAAGTLVDAIDRARTGAKGTDGPVTLPTDLIVRETTAAPPADPADRRTGR